MRFRVENMTCGGCARSVVKAIQSIDSAAAVETDVPGRSIEVHSRRAPEEIVGVLVTAGYHATRYSPAEPDKGHAG